MTVREVIPFEPPARRAASPEPLWRDLLGRQIRQRRHQRDETLGATAARAGISPQYLSEIERGVKEPSSEMVAAIAGALDTSLLDLTTDVVRELSAGRRPARFGARAALALAA